MCLLVIISIHQHDFRTREKIMRFGVQLPRLTPASLLLPRVLPPGPSCPPRTPSCRSGACPAAAPGMPGTPDLPSPASSLYGPGPEPPRPPTRCQFSPRSSPSPSRPPCCALLLSATITGKRECCVIPRKPALSLQLPYPCQVLAKIT